MSKQTKENPTVKLKELKRNEIICGILGLLTAVIAFIFMFVNSISFTGKITEDESITFSTKIWRLLSTNFTLYNEDWGELSLWSLINPNLNITELKTYVEIIYTVLAWFILIGIILSIIFYILFLCKKRLYWLCETATRAAAISGVVILLGLLLGYIKTSGNRIYLEGVNYNLLIPIIYSIIMIAVNLGITALLSYSKSRQQILKDLRAKKELEAAVAMESSLNTASASVAASETGKTITSSAMGQASAPAPSENGKAPNQALSSRPVTEEAKRTVLSRFNGKLTTEGYATITSRVRRLTVEQYQGLMKMPLKKKAVAIVLAIFLGGIGIDRFYVGDTKMGTYKIVGTVVAIICNLLIPIFGLIINIANWIWKFADIFISYKKIYDVNYTNAMSILSGK